MSKKHFIELAACLKRTEPRNPDRHCQWALMRDAIADLCAADNPRFDRARWLAYIADQQATTDYSADCPACLRGRQHTQQEHEVALARVYAASRA
jgi:hypothetical protein